jgi:glycopeptide antibiotics resistance protein
MEINNYIVSVYTSFIGMFLVTCFKTYKIVRLRKCQKNVDYLKEIMEGIFIIYLVAILAITLCPISFGQGRRINIIPFREVAFNIRNNGYMGSYLAKISLLNILIFVPYGFLGEILFRIKQLRGIAVLGYGLLLVIIIESTQYVMNTGRAADVDDVIFNMLGIAIGYIIGIVFEKIILSFFRKSI